MDFKPQTLPAELPAPADPNLGRFRVHGRAVGEFVVGDVGSADDFFLVGTAAEEASGYPLLTGTLLGTDGGVLCRLSRNRLAHNTGGCTTHFGPGPGYEIRDAAGAVVLRVEAAHAEGVNAFVTTLTGTFTDRAGRVVAMSDPADGLLAAEGVRFAAGWQGQAQGFAQVAEMTEQERLIAGIMVTSGGRAWEVLRGRIEGRDVLLDGKILVDASLARCNLHVASGHVAMVGTVRMEAGCNLTYSGAAYNVAQLVLKMSRPTGG
jgi:hypothetical protein